MSYLVLARKYRPRNFEALVGQSHVVQALANALTQQRLHHAYLFTGTRGVGKTTVSRILAKSLNCTGADGQGGITATPCGACSACLDIDAGRFVDYVELDAASNRGVEEISQLLDQSVYKPVTGRFKVYMIDEVHMLSNTAFNAMLKTLEEPPDYLKFVLATTDPQKVPPTVLSRCLQFNLRPMAPATVQSHLAQVLSDEQIAAEPGALRLLSRAARGSMRDALSLTDQAIAFGAGGLTEEGVRQMLGAVDRSHCLGLLEAVAARDGAALVARCHALREQGVPPAGTLEELAELCQQVAVYGAAPQALAEDMADDPAALDAVKRLAGLFAPDELQLFYSMSLHGRAELHLAPDEYSALLMTMLRMLSFRSGGPGRVTEAGRVPAEEPAVASSSAPPVAAPARPAGPASAAAVRMPQARSVAVPVPAGRPAPAAAAVPSVRATRPAPSDDIPPWLDAPPPEDEDAAPRRAAPREEGRVEPPAVSPRPVGGVPFPAEASTPTVDLVTTPQGDRWAAVVEALVQAGQISALVRELAWNAECIAVDEAGSPSRWKLRVEREMLRSPANCDKLQAALAAYFKTTVVLQVEGGAAHDTPARRNAAERARRQQQAEKIILEDPWVRSMLAQYATARIVPGSIQPRTLSSGETQQ